MPRPLVIPILFFLLGVIARRYFPEGSSYGVAAGLLAAFAAAAATLKRPRPFLVSMALFFFFLGAFRLESASFPRDNDISKCTACLAPTLDGPREAVIYGVVETDPVWQGGPRARHIVFTLRAEKLLIDEKGSDVSGHVRVSIYSFTKKPEAGDRIVVGGKLSKLLHNGNPEGFDYAGLLGSIGIYSAMTSNESDLYFKAGTEKGVVTAVRRYLFRVRSKAAGIIDRSLKGVSGSVIGTITLGPRDSLPPEIYDLFAKTGTAHILAVSGLHVSFVAVILLCAARLTGFPRRFAYLIVIPAICAYAVFTGEQASALRSALMASFALTALAIERKNDMPNALLLSAFCIIFLAPGQIFQAGFIMSYAAVLSMIYLVPVVEAYMGKSGPERREGLAAKVKKYFSGAVSVSLAAWAGMLPIVAAYFSMLTPSVIPANLIAVPLSFLLISLGLLLTITGSIPNLAPLTGIVSCAAEACVNGLVLAVQKISDLPLSYLRVPPLKLPFLSAYYAALAAAAWVFFKKKELKRSAALIFLVIAADIFVWNEVLIAPPNGTRVTFFDVKKADAALVEASDGGVMLVDAGRGGDSGGIDAGRNVIAPYLWKRGIRRLDCVFLSHPHDDHYGGLRYVFDNFEVGSFVDGGQKVFAPPEAKQIPRFAVKRGDVINGPGGFKIAVLNPPEKKYGSANDDSVVFKLLTPRANSFLFCGDATSEVMADMLSYGGLLRSDVIKVPHHGSGLGDMISAASFFDKVRPGYAVINAKNDDEINGTLLAGFRKSVTEVFVTSEAGAVIVEENERGGLTARGGRASRVPVTQPEESPPRKDPTL